jgi:hypothetical protein
VNFLSQMLPGFRHVRAPLISGYIWLFVAWLLLAGELPLKHESTVYRHAYELGEAAGPIGLALVASVAAYLVGSLVQVFFSSLGNGFAALNRSPFGRSWHAALGDTITLKQLLKPPLLEPESVGWIEGDQQTKARLRSLAEVELADSQETLVNAVGEAEEEVMKGLKSVDSPLTREDVYLEA